MFIDIHCHCHDNDIPGLCRGFGSPGSRYATPEELIEMMDDAGIAMAVMVSTMSPATRYCYVTPEEVIKTCRKYPDRLIPFCNIDPRFGKNSEESDFLDMLNIFKEAGFKGIGEYMPNIPFDDPLNMNLFKQVAQVGLPLQFHISPTLGGNYGCFDEIGLPRLEKVLKANPDMIMLGHSQMFWAEISVNEDPLNRPHYPEGKVTEGAVVRLMREYPNLHGDLSAGSGFNAISRDPEFGYKFLDEFQDRLYFGTDIASSVPRDLPQISYFNKLKADGNISEDVYEKITSQNAIKLLKLDI
jgi:uncharacterized protein